MLLCIGKVEPRAAVRPDGETLYVRKECSLVITGDHRYSDAAGYLQFYRCFQGYVEDPEHFDPIKFEERKPWDETEESYNKFDNCLGKEKDE